MYNNGQYSMIKCFNHLIKQYNIYMYMEKNDVYKVCLQNKLYITEFSIISPFTKIFSDVEAGMIVIYWLGTGIEIFKFKFSFSFAWIVPHSCVSLPSWHWSRQLSSGIVPVSFLSVPDFPQPKHVTRHILKSSANKWIRYITVILHLLRCCSVNQHSSYKY